MDGVCEQRDRIGVWALDASLYDKCQSILRLQALQFMLDGEPNNILSANSFLVMIT